MKSRIAFIAGAFSALAFSLPVAWVATAQQHEPAPTHGSADEHSAKGADVKVLLAQDLAEKLDGDPAKITMVEVSWEPGAESAPHRHPGPTFVYVLEGELDTSVDDGPILHLKQGDTLYEPSMALHGVARNPSDSKKTRVLAVHVQSQEAKSLVLPPEAREPSKP
jgi:quercetin dioxygenase-like cupin family protein